MLILITSAIRKLNISTWFLTLTKHCVDQDPLGGHILQLIRMILKNYFTIRLHHIIWVNKKMADDVEVCVVCSDNFIVNSKCIGCKLCRKKFHLICVGVKNSWQKLLVDVGNVFWFCDKCKPKCLEFVNTTNMAASGISREVNIVEKEVQCLKRELVLKDQLLNEKDYSISLQKVLLASYEKELNNPSSVCSRQEVNINNGQGQKGHSHAQMPSSSGAPARDASSFSLSSRRGNIGNTSNVTYASATANNNLNKQVRGTLGAQQIPTMHGNRTRGRQFLVGGDDTNNILTVPKYISLHVSRLSPGTKPEDLKTFLISNFPEVTCEPHQSKHPDLYASIKVNIKKEHFANAWKIEVWPNGALVSRFFARKRTPTQELDPNH